MAQIEVKFKNKEGVFLFIKSFKEKTEAAKKRTKDYMDTLTVVVFADVMDHFDKQKGPEGKWKMWSRIYRERMKKIGKSGNKILQDTGRMRQSFTPKNVKKRGTGIVWFNPAKTAKGFPYAAAHDIGGPKLPKREFMYLSDAGLEKVASATLRFIEG